jgi:hypothetical protein
MSASAAIPCALTFDHGNESGDATNSPQNGDATNSPQNGDATNSPQNGNAKELKRRRVWPNREGTRKADQRKKKRRLFHSRIRLSFLKFALRNLRRRNQSGVFSRWILELNSPQKCPTVEIIAGVTPTCEPSNK